MQLWLPGQGDGEQPRILVADDDSGSRNLLGVLLERAGATVLEAADGARALELARSEPLHLALLDVNMPAPDGIELTRLIRLQHNEAQLPVILVTGQTDTASKVAGLDAGATDFVAKPFEASELIARARVALRMRLAFDRLESVQSVLASLANAVDAKDPSTEHHCSRLADVSLELARAAGIDGTLVEAIGYGAVLHDVGKIGVSEAVIRKQGKLDEHELVQMRRHPLIGAGIVEPLRLGKLVAPIVRGHHERWDGAGYPDGLHRHEIPIGARVVAIVDAHDAMTHDRPYRRALDPDEARAELVRQAGRQFDPELTHFFLEEVLPRRVGGLPVDSPTKRGDFVPLTRGLVEEPAGH